MQQKNECSRGCDVAWPALPPDLSACDYFYGIISKVKFPSQPRTIEEPKQRIKKIAAIPEQMTRRVMENLRGSL
jgi:hypothetical protein